MKKIALLAMSAMCALTLVGCNKSKGPSAAALAAAANGDYSKLPVAKDTATKKAYDFGGLAITIYDWWSNPDAPAASKAEEDQRAYRKYLEETYNFTLQANHLLLVSQNHAIVSSSTSAFFRKMVLTQMNHTISREMENGHGKHSKQCVLL